MSDPAERGARRPPPTSGAGGLRSLAARSLLAGLTPLIPVPWLDDAVERGVRRRTLAALLRERGLDPTPADVDVVAGLERSGGRGCLGALLRGAVEASLYLLRKLFRKLVVVLAVHDGADAASRLFHDAYLLRHALSIGALEAGPGGRIDRDAARRVRRAMDATLAATDTSPLRQAVRRALVRRPAGDGAAAGRVADALWRQGDYRAALERRLETHLGVPES